MNRTARIACLFGAFVVPVIGYAQQGTAVVVAATESCSGCVIHFNKIVTLGARADSLLPSAISWIAADSHGRYFATSADGYRILVYGGSGSLQQVLGGRGQGPGEFESRNPQIAIGQGDSIFALSGRTVKVFSPDLAWQRSFSVPANFLLKMMTDNRVFMVGLIGRDSTSFPFHTMRAGESPTSFGPTRVARTCANCDLYSAGVSSDRRTVWTSTPGHHDLMQWDASGKLLSWFQLTHSPWFRPWDPALPRPSGLYVTRINDISQDQRGIIWMHGLTPIGPPASIRGAIGVAVPSTPDMPNNMASLAGVIEAFDPATRQLLASRSTQGLIRMLGRDLIAQLREESDGHVFWDVLRVEVRHE